MLIIKLSSIMKWDTRLGRGLVFDDGIERKAWHRGECGTEDIRRHLREPKV